MNEKSDNIPDNLLLYDVCTPRQSELFASFFDVLLMPYQENDTKFIPQLFYRILPLPFGIQTFQVHLNYYKEKDFNILKKFIESNSNKIITYDQAISKIKNNFSYSFIRGAIKKILQVKRINYKS